MAKDSRLVYSTDLGRVKSDTTDTRTDIPAGDGIVRIKRETKGRKGNGVSLIIGVPTNEKDLKVLAKQLKQRCGVGGTVKDGVIEIQTDQRELLKTELEKKGYTVKLAGG